MNDARENGIPTAMLWSASKLEVMLYTDHPDLLFGFFGISTARRVRAREMELRGRLAMKRKLARLFPPGCGHPDIIVHSVDDDTYPDADAPRNRGISGWFKVEFCGHYHGGIDVYLSVERIVVDQESGKWAFLDRDTCAEDAGNQPLRVQEQSTTVINTYTVGRIPFRNIFECDENGDEYYSDVHLYCRYADGGQPYESIVQRKIEGYGDFSRTDQVPLATLRK